jgi:hypothetical protein
MQWSADVTEHAHVEEIKVPTRAGNNQNYYSQIARHLDRLDKCFRFDLATYIKEHNHAGTADEVFVEEDHEPDTKKRLVSEYLTPICFITNYFSISSTLLHPSTPKPFRTFVTSTTAFHLATKPSLRLTLAEAAVKYQLPKLAPAISTFISEQNSSTVPLDSIKLQIWHNVRVQQKSYHNGD